MNLQGQIDKIEKIDETIAMPTVRNYSPSDEAESQSVRKDARMLPMSTVGGVKSTSSRNNRLHDPSVTSKNQGTLHTVNML